MTTPKPESESTRDTTPPDDDGTEIREFLRRSDEVLPVLREMDGAGETSLTDGLRPEPPDPYSTAGIWAALDSDPRGDEAEAAPLLPRGEGPPLEIVPDPERMRLAAPDEDCFRKRPCAFCPGWWRHEGGTRPAIEHSDPACSVFAGAESGRAFEKMATGKAKAGGDRRCAS